MRSIGALRWRSLVVLALGMCLLGWAGCSESSLPGPTGTVIGKVTYNGSPVPAGTTVTFVNQDNGMAAVGQVAANGAYTLLMRGERKVLTGAYRISLGPAQVSVDPASNPEAYKAIMEGTAKMPETATSFPEKYKNTETSGLTYVVQAGPNIYDIELKDEKDEKK